MIEKNNKFSHCPVCQSKNTRNLISIPSVPILCNILLPSRILAESTIHDCIEVQFCSKCGHVFNSLFDPRKINYTGDYENSLHHSPYFQKYGSSLANRLINTYKLNKNTIVEIGCGSGHFLETLCLQSNSKGYGFDPGYSDKNSTRLSDSVVITSEEYSYDHKDINPDFVVCRHVLEHVADPITFLRTIRNILTLHHDAVPVYFEVPSMDYSFREAGLWDFIYEHFSYFTVNSLAKLFYSAGFSVNKIQHSFGEQFIGIEATACKVPSENVKTPEQSMLNLKKSAEQFSKLCNSKLQYWTNWFHNFNLHDSNAVLWGAGSKGVTFLNIADKDRVIKYAVDLNPNKHNRYIAGSGQKIVPPDFLKELQPEYVLIANSLYQDEIKQMLNERSIAAEILCV